MKSIKYYVEVIQKWDWHFTLRNPFILYDGKVQLYEIGELESLLPSGNSYPVNLLQEDMNFLKALDHVAKRYDLKCFVPSGSVNVYAVSISDIFSIL